MPAFVSVARQASLAAAAVSVLLATACGRREPAAPAAPPEAPPASPPAAAAVAPAAPPAAAASPTSADLADLADKADARVGEILRCLLLLPPSPVALGAGERDAAATRGVAAMDDRRSSFFCKLPGDGLRSQQVLVWFPPDEKAALLDLDRDSEVALEVRGSFAGQPVALYRGQLGGARRPAPRKDRPDLLGATLWPDKLLPQDAVCRVGAPALPVAVGDEDQEARAALLTAGVKDLAPRKALLRCDDARGGSVGVAAYLPASKGLLLLEIGEGTEVALRLVGYGRNQLIARVDRIVAGGLPGGKEADPLRRFLLDPAPLVGQTAPCRVLLAPTPRPQGQAEAEARALLRAPVDPGWMSVACGAAGGSVPVELFFAPGKQAQMLTIGSESAIDVRLWGVLGGRVVATFEAITSGALPAPAPDDWRALTLDPRPAIGRATACSLLLRPYVGPRRGPAADLAAAFAGDEPLADTMAVVNCRDSAGAAGGTRVEVFWKEGTSWNNNALQPGQLVKLHVRAAGGGIVAALWKP